MCCFILLIGQFCILSSVFIEQISFAICTNHKKQQFPVQPEITFINGSQILNLPQAVLPQVYPSHYQVDSWLHRLETCAVLRTIKEEVSTLLYFLFTSSFILAYNHATYGSNFSFIRKNAKMPSYQLYFEKALQLTSQLSVKPSDL